MAVFNKKNFKKDDEYMTPKYVWENIKNYIPKNKIIWEPFYGDGNSGNYLRQLGFEVVNENIDFFQNNLGDIVVSNPPFSLKKKITERLIEIEKPFILIMPVSVINTQYMRIFKDKDLKFIIPKKRINFIKNGDSTIRCNFDCLYYCYNIDLPNQINWIN